MKRYAADPKAVAYLRNYYTPTGRLTKPMLALHTQWQERLDKINEIARAFSELREWKTSGVRPTGGELKMPAQAAQATGR